MGDIADKVTRLYNLRSKEDVVEVPVQLQLSDDSRFMLDLLANGRTHTGHVSDSDSSINDSDCKILIQSSLAKAGCSGQPVLSPKVGSDPTPSDNSISQQVINMQILSQLQSLGRRLDNMEAKNCNKTSDQSKVKNKSVKKAKTTENPVTVTPQARNAIQMQDALLQLKVEQRLKEIQDADKTGKIKPLHGGSVEVLVKNKVKWPHEYLLSSWSKERISYDQLAVVQWVADSCHIMKTEKNSDAKDCMLDYLVSLLDDAQDFSCEAAKASQQGFYVGGHRERLTGGKNRPDPAGQCSETHPPVMLNFRGNPKVKPRKWSHEPILSKVLAHTIKITTLKVLDTSMFAVCALPKVKPSHIRKLIAKISCKSPMLQKTSNCGY